MVIGIGSFLVITFGNYSRDVEMEKQQVQISNFNSKFLKYEGSDSVTIHDIITLSNFAIENNKKYELSNQDSGDESTYYVQVIANFKTKSSSIKRADLTLIDKSGNLISDFNEIIEENSFDKEKENKEVLYKCTKISISSITKRVYSIEFERIR